MKFDYYVKENTNNLFFVSGLTRSGKSLLCPIISSFENFEMFIMNSIAENILHMNFSGGIENKTAQILLKLSFNERFHDLTIGRNINFKEGDYTSVKKHINFREYINRSKNFNNKNLFREIGNKKFVIMFHDLLVNLKLIRKCYPNSKIINVTRHPVDLIFDWVDKKYDISFYKNIRNTTLSYLNGNIVAPYYMKFSDQKLKEKYNKFENIISQIYILEKFYEKNIKENKKFCQKNFLNVTFDNLAVNPHKVILKIEKLFKIYPSSDTKKILKNENCPREINYELRQKREMYIKKKLTKKTMQKLIYLKNNFNKLNKI